MDLRILSRWRLYLHEVFLPLSRLLACVVLYVGVQFGFQALLGRAPLVLTWDLVPAVLTLLSVLLYYRLADEFKDAETDRTYFPTRPVPSGRVSLQDLRLLMAANFAALALLTGVWRLAWEATLVLVVFAALMHQWFFLERFIATNRLLAFVTHCPIAILSGYFAVAVYAARFDIPVWSGAALLVTLWFALPTWAWEVARKTRAPGEEQPGYQTYSAMIGSTPSALVALSFVAAQVALTWALATSWPFKVSLVVAATLLASVFVRFAYRPSVGSAWLRPASELWGLVSTVGLIVDLVLTRGVRWSSLG